MPTSLTIMLARAVKHLAQMRGGGSAFPGLFIERIDPDFIARTLSQLPAGVVVVSGTNGKTTTTKMVVELLESQGMKVFTNRTGSNFTRGVAAALLGDIDRSGTLSADIAVLELDEAHAVHFVKVVKPRFSLLLNVLRDQLDRFGEIDTTAKLLNTVATATSEKVILNREDPRLLAVSKTLPKDKVVYFGLSTTARLKFPSDDDMREVNQSKHSHHLPDALSVLEEVNGTTGVFSLEGKQIKASLKIDGIYNVYNATAALALVASIIPTIDKVALTECLSTITPAFGRGEILTVGGQPLELVLVKNPGGFRLGLSSFDAEGYATMIAVNDNYADGRDMSWLWDVDFESLKNEGVSYVTGIRAYDMALRLQYDEVLLSDVNTDISNALQHFITKDADKPKRIFCTYTAMLHIRKDLSKITEVEVIS